MLRNVLESIEGIGILPTVALIIFVVAFIVMIIWVIRLPRRKVDRYSKMPLNDETPIDEKEGTRRDD